MRSAFAFAVVCLTAGSAPAYDQPVHALLSQRSYHGAPKLAAADDAVAVTALRARIYRAGAEARDPEVCKRFLARWPDAQRFDSWSMKRLFALNPDKHVAGFDEGVPLPAGDAAADVYALASRLPDDDERNRDRFRHDDKRGLVNDGWQRPLPEDPATLEMGSLSGLSSQAHAHYGLPKLAFSSEPSVLKSDPRRFAVPPTVHTFGAELADSYTTLAVLSARLPGGERLALTHAGAAAHHLEDVANQIHTVQVGLYDFFVDAKLQSIKEELLSVGGLMRPRPGFVSIGIDIIANHHVLAEELYAKHLLAPNDPVATLTAQAKPDAELQKTFAAQPAGCAPGFGRTLADALIERSSHEGPDVYRAIRAVAQRRWSQANVHFGEREDPDAALKPDVDLSAFYQLEVAGARRAVQTLDAWWTHFDACRTVDEATADALAEALVKQRLDALDLAEGRARLWTPSAPEQTAINPWPIVGYAIVMMLLGLGLRRLVRRKR